MLKIIIAGSRSLTNYQIVKMTLNRLFDKQLNFKDVEIVSGNANGIDKHGERYAKEKGFDLVIMPANWDKHGKSAGYIRNEKMAQYADMLIAIHDGKSKGTQHMIDLAHKHGLTVYKTEI